MWGNQSFLPFICWTFPLPLSFVSRFTFRFVIWIWFEMLIVVLGKENWKGQDVSETKNHKKTLSYFFVSHTQDVFNENFLLWKKLVKECVYETSHIVGLSQSNNHNKSFNLLLFCCRWVNKCWLSFSISFLPSNIFISLL